MSREDLANLVDRMTARIDALRAERDHYKASLEGIREWALAHWDSDAPLIKKLSTALGVKPQVSDEP